MNASIKTRIRLNINDFLLQYIHSKEMKDRGLSWRMERLKTKPLISWDKRTFRGREYGARETNGPRKPINPSRHGRRIQGSKGTQCDVIRSYKVFFCNQITKINVSPNGPYKDHST